MLSCTSTVIGASSPSPTIAWNSRSSLTRVKSELSPIACRPTEVTLSVFSNDSTSRVCTISGARSTQRASGKYSTW